MPPLAAFGDGYRFHMTGLAHDERGYPTTDPEEVAKLLDRMHGKIDDHVDEIVAVERFLLDDADVCVFAFGIVAAAARDAVLEARARGVRAGLLRPITLWPFPDEAVAETAAQADMLLVAEMNRGQIVREVERAAAGRSRIEGCFRADGEPILPSELLAKLTAGLPRSPFSGPGVGEHPHSAAPSPRAQRPEIVR